MSQQQEKFENKFNCKQFGKKFIANIFDNALTNPTSILKFVDAERKHLVEWSKMPKREAKISVVY